MVKKIYFVGHMKSPFIKQDKEILSQHNTLTTFDLSVHALSFWQAPKYLASCLLELTNVLRADLIWIWFADYPALPFLMMAKLIGKPSVVRVGGWEVCKESSIHYGAQLNPVRGWIARWILRNCSQSIVMSESYQKIVTHLVPETNCIIIPGWIDISMCDIPLPEKHGIITAFCDYTGVYLLKGTNIFEKATGGMDARIIKDKPHTELIQTLLESKVYCQLSYTETFGMVLLEAMACGCVPVVARRGNLPHLIGDTGCIVKFGDIESTRAAIITATSMDGSKARHRAREFGRQNALIEIESLIEDLCHNLIKEPHKDGE